MHHDVQKFVKKFTNGLLVDMVHQAVDNLWVFLENIWDYLLLLSVDKESYQLGKVTREDWV